MELQQFIFDVMVGDGWQLSHIREAVRREHPEYTSKEVARQLHVLVERGLVTKSTYGSCPSYARREKSDWCTHQHIQKQHKHRQKENIRRYLNETLECL